jgi:1,2-diacylglycerol-3-alpha-glucose alpha-1,2-galactosyltransferase
MISETTWTVQGHGVHTAFLEMAAGLSKHEDIDLMVNRFRRADITHIQTIGPYALLHLLFGRGKKIISVHVIPDSFVGSIIGNRWWYGLSVQYLRFFYGRADRLLAVSEEVKSKLISQLEIKKPIDIVFNTIDTDNFHSTTEQREQARASLDINQNQFVVVGNGQIQPRKRFDIFVSLAASQPDIRFFWVGGIPFKQLGAEYKTMQKLIGRSPHNLTVTGVVERSQVKRYFYAGDAFLLPSEQENHPMAVIEAAAADLPIIVRDIPSYDSAFANDVLRGTDDTFVDLILKLKDNAKFREQAAIKSRNIANRFDNASGSERLIQIYRKTLAQ